MNVGRRASSALVPSRGIVIRVRSASPLLLISACVAALPGCTAGPVKPELVYFPSSPATARVVHLKSFNRLSELVPTRTTFVDLFRNAAQV